MGEAELPWEEIVTISNGPKFIPLHYKGIFAGEIELIFSGLDDMVPEIPQVRRLGWVASPYDTDSGQLISWMVSTRSESHSFPPLLRHSSQRY